MSKRLAFSVCFILSLAAFTPSAPSGHAADKSEITIKAYNYAGERTEILERAFAIASRVFRKAGVVTIWLNCPVPNEPSKDPVCEATNGPAVLMVNILPRSMTAAFALPEGVFGLAVLSPDGQPACLAYVFHDRVAELASAHSHNRHNRAVVLGHVLAHEIGHLLLRSTAHTPSGIMSGDWYPRNLRSASQGQLLFPASQSAHLRKEVAARLRDRRAMQTGPGLVPILLIPPVGGNAQAVNGPNGQPCQQESAGSSTAAETIVLPLEPLASRGLLLIRVTVNGRAGRLALDTGAGQTTISWQLAAISREVFERETKAVRQQSSTHTWVTLPAKVTLGIGPLVERRAVQIGDFDEVSRLAGTQIDGVLGTDVLADFGHIAIDFRARTLTLRKSVTASLRGGQPQDADTKVPAVELILSNFAGAPQDVFDSATRQARTIFALAGVNLDLVTCLAHERANDTRCAQQPGANQIHVRLLRRPCDRKIEFDPHTGGVAIRGTEARSSGFVTIITTE